MTRENQMVEDLVTTVRRGSNEAVRQNAVDLLYKLASDGLRAAKRAVDAMERIRKANSQEGHRP